jgi:hypothetical protein
MRRRAEKESLNPISFALAEEEGVVVSDDARNFTRGNSKQKPRLQICTNARFFLQETKRRQRQVKAVSPRWKTRAEEREMSRGERSSSSSSSSQRKTSNRTQNNSDNTTRATEVSECVRSLFLLNGAGQNARRVMPQQQGRQQQPK